MDTETYVILNPHSATNESDQYRVVEYSSWIRYADGTEPLLPITSSHDDRASAQAAADKLNGRQQA